MLTSRPEAHFPDYRLPDHTSTPRTLSQLQGDDPLILTLARGHSVPESEHQRIWSSPSGTTSRRL